MISRQRQRDVLARFDAYKLKNRLDVPTAHEALRYCFRYVKRGVSCALVVSDMQSVNTIMKILQGDHYYENLSVIKKKGDGFIFEGDVEFRVLPKNNESLAHIMLGKNAKIIQAREGDPKMKKFNEIMGL
jgi:hypothetical protein